MSNDPRPYFFLSYAHADRDVAIKLQQQLDCTEFFIRRDDDFLVPGEVWRSRIREEIRVSQGVIYLVTPASSSSRYVSGEISIASMYERNIIPVWAAGDEYAEIALIDILEKHYIDIRGSRFDEGLRQIKHGLRQYLHINKSIYINPIEDTPKPDTERSQRQGVGRKLKELYEKLYERLQRWLSPVDVEQRLPRAKRMLPLPERRGTKPPRNPYKGLASFQKDDAKDFFGRDRLIGTLALEMQQILHEEKENRRTIRCLTVIGPSGSGKSSVVMAGLLPYLQKELYRRDPEHREKYRNLHGSQSWLYLDPIKPGTHPVQTLSLALSEYIQDASYLRKLLVDEVDSTRGLYFLLQQIAKQKRLSGRIVLFIDQFEELFAETTNAAERERFIKLLKTAATEPDNNLLMVTTIRADFTDYLMHDTDLYQMMEAHRVAVPPMTMEELRAVIIEPAKNVEVTFERDLVGDLLFAMQGQEEALPLLQFTLEKLFEYQEHGLITQSTYNNELGGLTGAVGRYADDLCLQLDKNQQYLAQMLFIRLVNPGGLDREATRRRVFISELAYANSGLSHEMDDVIKLFVDARLLIRGHGDSDESATLELVHEALISSWGRLAQWIDEARADIRLRQTLNNDIDAWNEHQQSRTQLYSGQRLRDARSWAKRALPNKKEEEFLQRSQKNKQRKRNVLISAIAIILILVVTLSFVGYTFGYVHLIPNQVTNLNDSGAGSLRQIIHDASADSTITFSPFLYGTITLTSGDLVIDKSLTIDGNNPQNITISNGKKSLGKYQSGNKVSIIGSSSVTLKNLSFENSAVDKTAFIDNEANLTVEDCIIAHNFSNYDGGGISSTSGSLLLTNSQVSQNSAQGNGGGIYAWLGSVTLDHSQVYNNTSAQNGGGIFVQEGSLILNSKSTVYQNRTSSGDPTSNGGGISVQSGTLFLNSSNIYQNTTRGYGGGLALLGSTGFIENSIIWQNSANGKGGGLAVEKDSENNKTSIVVLSGVQVAMASHPTQTYYIGLNTTKAKDSSSKDVLGHETPVNSGVRDPKNDQSSSSIITDDDSEVTGSPAPTNPPEKTNYYLGSINWDGYCHSTFPHGTISVQLGSSSNIQCVSLNTQQGNQSLKMDPQAACIWQNKKLDVMPRLADYYDPSSWQCYQHVNDLGPITSHFNDFCKSLGDADVYSNTTGNAYDWKCETKNNALVSISVGDACIWYYQHHLHHVHNIAFYALMDFTNPDGWECYGA